MHYGGHTSGQSGLSMGENFQLMSHKQHGLHTIPTIFSAEDSVSSSPISLLFSLIERSPSVERRQIVRNANMTIHL